MALIWLIHSKQNNVYLGAYTIEQDVALIDLEQIQTILWMELWVMNY